MMLSQAIMISMPGVPGIYFHSLVGSRNFNKGVEESGIKRRINREKLNYDTLKQELATEGSLRNTIFTTYKKLLNIRTQETAFNPFGFATYTQVVEKVFIIKREHNNETIFAIYNFSNTPVKMEALAEKVVDLVQEITIEQSVWEIAPYQFYWFKKK